MADILPLTWDWDNNKIMMKYPTLTVSSAYANLGGPQSVSEYIAEQVRKAQDELMMRENSIRFYNEYMINPKTIIKKETNKMEAKKCDRCGKLYEKKFDKNDIQCVFKHEETGFSEEEQKKYSKEFLEDRRTHHIYIKTCGDDIDLCPDCRKAFKTWFENADKEKK